MMRDPPIQKRLLIHSAELRRGSRDSWGKEDKPEITQLRFVRFEPSRQVSFSKDNRQLALKSKMFYCCANSQPSGIKFSEGDRIIFGGEEYLIERIDILYGSDPRRPHHYELGLM